MNASGSTPAKPEHRFLCHTDGPAGHHIECTCRWKTKPYPTMSEASAQWRAHAGLPPILPPRPGHPAWCVEALCDAGKPGGGSHTGDLLAVSNGHATAMEVVTLQQWQPDETLMRRTFGARLESVDLREETYADLTIRTPEGVELAMRTLEPFMIRQLQRILSQILAEQAAGVVL